MEEEDDEEEQEYDIEEIRKKPYLLPIMQFRTALREYEYNMKLLTEELGKSMPELNSELTNFWVRDLPAIKVAQRIISTENKMLAFAKKLEGNSRKSFNKLLEVISTYHGEIQDEDEEEEKIVKKEILGQRVSTEPTSISPKEIVEPSEKIVQPEPKKEIAQPQPIVQPQPQIEEKPIEEQPKQEIEEELTKDEEEALVEWGKNMEEKIKGAKDSMTMWHGMNLQAARKSVPTRPIIKKRQKEILEEIRQKLFLKK